MGTSKRERQKANRQKRRAEDAKVERRSRLTRTILQWGLGAIAIFIAVVAVFWLTGGFDDEDDQPTTPTTVATAPAGDTSAPPTSTGG